MQYQVEVKNEFNQAHASLIDIYLQPKLNHHWNSFTNPAPNIHMVSFFSISLPPAVSPVTIYKIQDLYIVYLQSNNACIHVIA